MENDLDASFKASFMAWIHGFNKNVPGEAIEEAATTYLAFVKSIAKIDGDVAEKIIDELLGKMQRVPINDFLRELREQTKKNEMMPGNDGEIKELLIDG